MTLTITVTITVTQTSHLAPHCGQLLSPYAMLLPICMRLQVRHSVSPPPPWSIWKVLVRNWVWLVNDWWRAATRAALPAIPLNINIIILSPVSSLSYLLSLLLFLLERMQRTQTVTMTPARRERPSPTVRNIQAWALIIIKPSGQSPPSRILSVYLLISDITWIYSSNCFLAIMVLILT